MGAINLAPSYVNLRRLRPKDGPTPGTRDLAEREPQLYERAALRWLARFCLERRHATLTTVAEAADALALLSDQPDEARAELRRLLGV